MVPVHEVGRPGRRTRRCDERVEIRAGQRCVDPERSAERTLVRERGVVLGRGVGIAFGQLEELLLEPLELLVRVRVVERDAVRERVHRDSRPCRQVGVQVSLELVDEDDELVRAAVDLVDGREVGRIDERRSRRS